jgi:hypothetical protein
MRGSRRRGPHRGRDVNEALPLRQCSARLNGREVHDSRDCCSSAAVVQLGQ